MQAIITETNGFFAWLWRASWQASVIVVVVLLAQWLLRRHLTPRWRHALWFVVLVRLALPWSVRSPISLFNLLAVRPPAQQSSTPEDLPAPVPGSETQETQDTHAAPAPLTQKMQWMSLRWIWLTGVVVLPGYLFVGNYRLGRMVRGQRPVTDGALLGLLEDCKQEMRVSTPLTLVETAAVESPSLFGFIRPRLLLPAGLTRCLSLQELRYVFLHELAHVKRRDIPIHWLMTAALILHWFNPLVWYAWNRLRLDRELACDAMALSHTGETENKSYGQTLIKLIESFSRPPMTPVLVGIIEDKNQMKRRISMIAKFKRTSGWPVLAAATCGVLALVTLTDAQTKRGTDAGNKAGPSNSEGPPRIVSTSPKVGETEVSPSLTEIIVTFDRDMAGGFSWTGGPPDFPPSPDGQKAKWRDKRTCLLPVKLQAARYYRVGINSTSFQNFKSADGTPARPSAIYFTTQGASEQLKRRASMPVIIGLEPKNGSTDVDPNLKELRVTFNVPMGDGCSWTGGGEQFPTIPTGKKPSWSEDHKTCVLPVELKPGWEYHLGLNSPSFKNFQSAGGVPLEPVRYTFKTR